MSKMDNNKSFTENELLDMIESDNQQERLLGKSKLSEKIKNENQTLEQAVNTILLLASGYVCQMSGYSGHHIYSRQYIYAGKILEEYVKLNKIDIEALKVEQALRAKELRRKQFELLKIEFGNE